MSSNRPARSKINSVKERDNHTCQNCNRSGGRNRDLDLEVHHVVPLSSGGSNRKSNLKTLCSDCHKSIHSGSKAPTAESNPDRDHKTVAYLIIGSVYTAINHPIIVMAVVGLFSVFGLLNGQEIVSTLFFISAGTFVGIIQYAKYKGDGGAAN